MRPLIAEIHETAERLSSRQNALQGRLRITVPMTFGTMYLGPLISEFARQHRDLEMAIDYDDRVVDLVRNGYDVGIRIGTLKDSSLRARKLIVSRRIVCCSPAYARERGLPKNIAELAAHDCIDYANVHTSQFWQFEGDKSGRKATTVTTHSRIVTNNGEAIRDAAIAGLGIVLLPFFLAAEPLRQETLIPVLLEAKPLPYTIYAVYPPTRHVSIKVRTFIDYLLDAFTHSPPWERDLREVEALTEVP